MSRRHDGFERDLGRRLTELWSAPRVDAHVPPHVLRRAHNAARSTVALLAVGTMLVATMAFVGLRQLSGSGGPQPVGPGPATSPSCVQVPKPGVDCSPLPPGYSPAPKDGTFSPIPVGGSPSYPDPPGSIMRRFDPPGPAGRYDINNAWWNRVDGMNYEAWAGGETGQPSQGVVVVMTDPANDDAQIESSFREYRTPGRDGAATIVSAAGMVLTITTSDGTTLRFDVITGRYSP